MVWLLFAAFFTLVILRVPVGFALILSSLAIIVLDGIPTIVVVQKLYEGLNSFVILAIPFFYLVGNLCNSGGFTERLLRLSHALIGHVRGGLAHVNVVVSMFFAGLSGSSTADTAGIGSVLIPAMMKNGYDARFTVAVTAISSTMGVIIPPSILMVFYGAMGNVSIGLMFLGGFIPGVMMGLGQMAIVWMLAVKRNFPTSGRASLRELGASMAVAAVPFGVPVLIIGGIIGGVFTPTEAAAVSAVYVLFVSLCLYRMFDLRSLTAVFTETGRFIGIPLFCTASATLFAWLLAYYGFPEYVTQVARVLGAGRLMTFAFIVVIYLIVGTFMDSIPAIIMLLPVIQALGNDAGIHPVQLGVVVVLTLALGLVTPPYGICLLMASQIAGITPRDAVPMTMLFGISSLVVIALAVVFPEVVLFIPRLVWPQYM